MPVRERLKKVLLAVKVEVYRPPRPDVVKVENDAERAGRALQELHDLVPCRPRDRDVLASDAYEKMARRNSSPATTRSLAAGTAVDLASAVC